MKKQYFHVRQIYMALEQIKKFLPSSSNFKFLSRSLEYFFLTVGQNNFGNKIPFHLFFFFLLTLGPPLPKAMYGFSMLELKGDAYVIGGGNYNAHAPTTTDRAVSTIYKLSCSSGLCCWTTLSQQLKVARVNLVAMPVQDNFCT